MKSRHPEKENKPVNPIKKKPEWIRSKPVSYTHLRAHETRHDLVCRLLLEKKELLSDLKKEELTLTNKIEDMDHKNLLLSTNLDLDYVETLIRERFLFGKKNETIYIIKKDEK